MGILSICHRDQSMTVNGINFCSDKLRITYIEYITYGFCRGGEACTPALRQGAPTPSQTPTTIQISVLQWIGNPKHDIFTSTYGLNIAQLLD